MYGSDGPQINDLDSFNTSTRCSDIAIDDSKNFLYVWQMFWDLKFDGHLSQVIMETLHLYNKLGHQKHLSQQQKADFFVHILDGPARKLYIKNAI